MLVESILHAFMSLASALHTHHHRSHHVSRSQHREPLHDWSGVAECESGGDWTANTGNGFEGGLQFMQSTWLANGGGEFAEHAYDATQVQQIEVAERLLRTAGVGSWPVCGRYLRSAA